MQAGKDMYATIERSLSLVHAVSQTFARTESTTANWDEAYNFLRTLQSALAIVNEICKSSEPSFYNDIQNDLEPIIDAIEQWEPWQQKQHGTTRARSSKNEHCSASPESQSSDDLIYRVIDTKREIEGNVVMLLQNIYGQSDHCGFSKEQQMQSIGRMADVLAPVLQQTMKAEIISAQDQTVKYDQTAFSSLEHDIRKLKYRLKISELQLQEAEEGLQDTTKTATRYGTTNLSGSAKGILGDVTCSGDMILGNVCNMQVQAVTDVAILKSISTKLDRALGQLTTSISQKQQEGEGEDANDLMIRLKRNRQTLRDIGCMGTACIQTTRHTLSLISSIKGSNAPPALRHIAEALDAYSGILEKLGAHWSDRIALVIDKASSKRRIKDSPKSRKKSIDQHDDGYQEPRSSQYGQSRVFGSTSPQSATHHSDASSITTTTTRTSITSSSSSREDSQSEQYRSPLLRPYSSPNNSTSRSGYEQNLSPSTATRPASSQEWEHKMMPSFFHKIWKSNGTPNDKLDVTVIPKSERLDNVGPFKASNMEHRNIASRLGTDSRQPQDQCFQSGSPYTSEFEAKMAARRRQVDGCT